MSICKRDNCSNHIGDIFEARKLRLCAKHFEGRALKAGKRELRKLAKCQYCGKSIANTRNKIFCSNECRHKGHRVIDDDFIIKLTKHSWWLSVESMLKNNPYGLGSINDPNDIVDLLSLYRIKAAHQKAYNVLNNEWVLNSDGQPISHLRPWLELEVSHRYPNSKGGSNRTKNLLIAPKLINRMLKDTLPLYTRADEFSGLQAAQIGEPVKTTLLKELTVRYGCESVQTAINRIRFISFVDIKKPRRLFGVDTIARPPLEKLFQVESLRLGLYKLRDAVTALAWHLNMMSGGIDNELLAIACFHALLKGDSEHFLAELQPLPEYLGSKKEIPDEMKKYGVYGWYTNKLHQYMKRYFGLDMNCLEDRIDFYNSFFTVPALNKEGSHIII
ncbi:hypothetical protein ACV8S3_23045 [Citrobacter freundii]